jgi:anti-sigma B factor antagonist
MGLEAEPTRVISTAEPDRTVLRICGELDMASRDAVEPEVMAAILTESSVIIDLAELTFCDSNGIAMFIAVDEKAKAEGTNLVVRGAVPQVRRVFEITGVDHIITVADGDPT